MDRRSFLHAVGAIAAAPTVSALAAARSKAADYTIRISEAYGRTNRVQFLRKPVAGATPLLAPGSLVLLGLVGVAHAYRHPASVGRGRQEINQ